MKRVNFTEGILNSLCYFLFFYYFLFIYACTFYIMLCKACSGKKLTKGICVYLGLEEIPF